MVRQPQAAVSGGASAANDSEPATASVGMGFALDTELVPPFALALPLPLLEVLDEVVAVGFGLTT